MTKSKPSKDKIQLNAEYMAAREFQTNWFHSLSNGESHEKKLPWLAEYAKWQFELSEQTWKDNDSKAETVIRFLGGGFGLITFAALASIDQNNMMLFLATAPSIVAAIAGVLFATAARWPSHFSRPPSVSVVSDLKQTDKYGQAVLIPILHVAETRLRIINRRKSKWLRWAYGSFATAIVLLALPLIVALAKN